MISKLKRRGERLNTLLRGEIAAVETYEQAIEEMDEATTRQALRQLLEEHREAVDQLRYHVLAHAAEAPDDDSGAWGVWARTFQAAANLLGDTTALKSLKEGEEHGVKEYEDALEDDSLSAECLDVIRLKLLPRTREHIKQLDVLSE